MRLASAFFYSMRFWSAVLERTCSDAHLDGDRLSSSCCCFSSTFTTV